MTIELTWHKVEKIEDLPWANPNDWGEGFPLGTLFRYKNGEYDILGSATHRDLANADDWVDTWDTYFSTASLLPTHYAILVLPPFQPTLGE